MAGTIFGLPLSQHVDANGDPLVGALLYIYAANTSTPSTVYEDFGLTTGLELSNPMESDASGRFPQFWLDDGSYRVRLTDADGNEIFDEASITAIGASSGASGGSGSTVDSTRLFDTGDMFWTAFAGTRSGWVRANGRTIGNAASGATERANADTSDLYSYLWNNFSDSLCPVTGGRGGSAAADFSASKPIATLDMRDHLSAGLDDMGASAAGIISGGTTAGAAGATSNVGSVSSGTWTPALNFGGATTGITYTSRRGDYIKIDNEVTLWASLTLSSNGTATGSATITGLPFDAQDASGYVAIGTMAGTATEWDASVGISYCRLTSNASAIELLESVDEDDANAFTDGTGNGQIGDTDTINIKITYITDDATVGTSGDVALRYRLGSWYFKL